MSEKLKAGDPVYHRLSNVILPPALNPVTVDEENLQRSRIIAHHPRAREADIFRILRTQIIQTMSGAGYKTLAVTSPNYGDGKSTIALNLAVSIALDLKQTVLLADLDLRKPSIAKYLGIPSGTGLSDHLLHNVPLPECLFRTSFQRLSVLPAGPALDASSEALGSPKMTALAQELKTRYPDRMIIYDMPPILAQADPMAFLPNVDAVLMVIRDEKTRLSDINRSMAAVAGANIIGTVLNNAAPLNGNGLLEKLLKRSAKFRQ